MNLNLFLCRAWLRARFTSERGAGLVEYILLVALIAVAIVAAVSYLGGALNTKYSQAGSQLGNLP